MKVRILGVLLAALIGYANGIAQTPGNVIAVNATGAIFEVSAGSVTTIGQLPTGQIPRGMAMSIDNRAVMILTDQTTTRVRSLRLLELRAGALTTLGAATTPGGPVSLVSDGAVIADQRGDYIASTPLGLLRYSGVGSGVTTILTSVFSGVSEDLSTGGWLTFNAATLFRVARGGRVTSIASISGPVAFGSGDVITDTVNGDALVFRVGSVIRVSLPGGTFSTLTSGTLSCGDIVPATRSLVLGSSIGVLRADLQGQNVSMIAQVPNGVTALTVFGSRYVAGFGAATPGSMFTILASFPEWPNRGYQLAMSLGYKPGIPTSSGVIPLVPDPLFFLSMNVPTVFVNFAGRLDSQGIALANVNIPNSPALVGLVVYYGGVAFDQSGILTIAEPVTLVIE